MYILIEFSESIVLSYDLSDTHDGIRCERNAIYILVSSPCDKNSGKPFRAHGPSC